MKSSGAYHGARCAPYVSLKWLFTDHWSLATFRSRCVMKVFLSMLSVAVLLAANPALGQGPIDLVKQGQEVYENNCADCHRGNGEGLPVKFPALKGNAFVMGDPKPVLDTVLNGRKGKLGQMPAWH